MTDSLSQYCPNCEAQAKTIEELRAANERWAIAFKQAEERANGRIETLLADNAKLREALFESVALNENYYAVEEDDGYQFTEAPAVIAQARTALEARGLEIREKSDD